ncbi:PHD-finger domain-containing protein [Ditylenchus destructor]|uniref:PHD-finger domain-containing protein n=1 Tax=Ditylenchus destructor TaxID=166010 RepID=A0AAD4MNI6_9BILA|nr:PHD-finger domain-containing protein [Ditylenchus destructor]
MKANDEQASSKQSASSAKSKVPFPVNQMTQATIRVLENMGFTSAHQSCVYSLSSMMRNYFERLCSAASASADHAGRESLILEDANVAFKTMGVNMTELHDYIREVDNFTPELNVPLFPVPKSMIARFGVPNKKIPTEEKSGSTLTNVTEQAENAIKKRTTDEEVQRCEDRTSETKRSLVSPTPAADQRPSSSLNKEYNRSQKQFPSFFGSKAHQLGFVVAVPPKPKIELPVKSAHHGNATKVAPAKVPFPFQMPAQRPTPDRPVEDRLAAAKLHKIPDQSPATVQPTQKVEGGDALLITAELKLVRVERREPPPRPEAVAFLEAEKAGPSRPVVEEEPPKAEVSKGDAIQPVVIHAKVENLKLKSNSAKVQKQKPAEPGKAITPPPVEVAAFIPDLLPTAEDGGETTEPYIQESSDIVHKKKKAKKEKKHKDHDKEKEKKEKKKRKRNRDEESSDTAAEKDTKRRKHSESLNPSPEEPRVPKLTIKFGPKTTTSATPVVSVEPSVVDLTPTSSSAAPTQPCARSPLPSTSIALKGISIKCVDPATPSTSHAPSTSTHLVSTHLVSSQKKTAAQNEEILGSMHAANPRRTRKSSSSLASSRPAPQRIDSSPQFTTPIAPGPSSSGPAVRKTSTAGSGPEAKPSTSGSAMGPTPVVKALKIARKGLTDAGDRTLGMSQEFRMSQEETSQEEVSRKEKKKPGIKKQSALGQSEEELIPEAAIEKSTDAPESKTVSVTPEEVKRSDSSLKIKPESQIREPKGPRTPPIISLTEDTQPSKPAPKKQPSLKKSRSRDSDKLEFPQPGKKAKVIPKIDIEALPLPLQSSKFAAVPPTTSTEPKATPVKHGRKQSKPRRIESAEISDEHREEEAPSQVLAPVKPEIKAKTAGRARKPSGSKTKKKESLTEAFGKEFHIGNTESPHSDSTIPAFAAPDQSNDMAVEPMEEEDGDVWICPVCSVAYVDGTADMVGCDGCDSWFHWHCVGIQIAPPEDKQWYCSACNKKKKGAPAKKTGPGSKPKKKGH